jgi:hypothetical protein
MSSISTIARRVEGAPMPIVVQDLVREYATLWSQSEEAGLPLIGPAYSAAAQARNERHLDRFLNVVHTELAARPHTDSERQAMRERLVLAFTAFARDILDIDERALDMLRTGGLVEATVAFAQMAGRFDPAISSEDVYQAGRNVWTASFLQLLLGMPAQLTPAIFAYSMLYPYTDNYLDDPTIDQASKQAFNERFRRRLAGEFVAAHNRHEQIVSDLVGMIEGQFDRARYAQVFESLLAIHQAQGKSLHQMRHAQTAHGMNVLEISIEKGGTSVLADGYLAAGTLDPAQREAIFGLGVVTQLLDDLEDLPQNLADGFTTIFSQAAAHEPLDRVTSRALHFCMRALERLDGIGAPDRAPLKELLKRGVSLLLIDSAGRAAHLYSRRYLQELERFSPLGFAALRRRRKQLARRQVSAASLLEAFVGSEACARP